MSCFSPQDEASRNSKAIEQQLKKDKDVYKSTHRLLLLGKIECVCLCVFSVFVCVCVYMYVENV